MIRSGLALAVALALVCAFASPAMASGPPLGKYGCTIGQGYAGDLRILSGHRYRVNTSRIGRFRVLSAHKFKFTTGTWKGLFSPARWHRTSDGVIEIEMSRAGSNYINTYCDKEKG
jgi:hypothetical protein